MMHNNNGDSKSDKQEQYDYKFCMEFIKRKQPNQTKKKKQKKLKQEMIYDL